MTEKYITTISASIDDPQLIETMFTEYNPLSELMSYIQSSLKVRDVLEFITIEEFNTMNKLLKEDRQQNYINLKEQEIEKAKQLLKKYPKINMTELQLYKFLQDNSVEYRDTTIWLTFSEAYDFYQMIESYFDTETVLETQIVNGGYIAIDIEDICKHYDINPQNILTY